MSDDDPRILEVLRAVAAGETVDWSEIEARAVDDASLAFIRQIRVVSSVADFHRSLRADDAEAANARPEGSTWGVLTLREPVGRGSFGRVYRAWDPRLERDVALKLLEGRHEAGDDVATAVIDEGRILAKLHHPNVVSIFGADRVDGEVGLSMEFVSGRSLDRIVRELGALGADETALIGRDVCRALAAIHHAGLVHRDVKAQNVMRESGGRIILMDLGAGRDAGAMEPGALAGTPLYLAPEVLAGHPATPRSDLYSLGVLLYYLVTSEFPVRASSLTQLRDAHTSGQRTRLRNARPDLPERFIQVIDRALEPDPADRFDSAGTFEAALSDALGHDDRHTQPGERPRAMWPKALVAVAVLVAVAAGAWMFWPARAEMPTRFTIALEKRLTMPYAPGAAEFAWSPDGSTLAYTVVDVGSKIRFHSTSDFDSKPFTESMDDSQPFYSPDGRWIGYRRTEPPFGKLAKSPVAGGPAIPLADWPYPGGASWDRDGTIVFSSKGDLWRISEAGGTPTPVTHVDRAHGESAIRPQVLPGGGTLFTLRGRRGDALAIVSRDGLVTTVIDHATSGKYLPPGYLVFLLDDWIMAAPFTAATAKAGPAVRIETLDSPWFDVSATGALAFASAEPTEAPPQLVWLDRQSGKETPLPAPADGLRPLPGTMRLSPDGRWLAVAQPSRATEVLDDSSMGRLWVADVARGVVIPMSTTAVRPLAWAPDSVHITFRNSRGEIVWKRIDGTGEDEVIAASSLGPFDRCQDGAWAPDEQTLVLVCDDGPKALGFASRDAIGRTAPRITLFLPDVVAPIFAPTFSPDGRFVAYQTGVIGVHGSQQIFVRPFPGPGAVAQVSANRGHHPEWRGDNLFYSQPGGTLIALRVTTYPGLRAGVPTPAIASIADTADPGPSGFEFSPDGRRVLVLHAGGARLPGTLTRLKVILHWVDDVRRKIAAGS